MGVPGAFLIRVSERVHGYALSFRHGNRIRHYKLGFSRNGGYEVVGNSEEFATLIELVEFFHDSPVTPGDTDRYERNSGLRKDGDCVEDVYDFSIASLVYRLARWSTKRVGVVLRCDAIHGCRLLLKVHIANSKIPIRSIPFEKCPTHMAARAG